MLHPLQKISMIFMARNTQLESIMAEILGGKNIIYVQA